MALQDPRIDTYIASAQPFARPILNHIRKLVHTACPEVEETMKWSFPHFDYKGIMISMAAFKAHCALNIWKGALIPGLEKVSDEESGMGRFGRIASLEDLPQDDQLLAYFREAKRLNEENVRVQQKPKEKSIKELVIPEYLVESLKEHPKAQEIWDKFSNSHRKEYIEWISGAKTEETRQKRLAIAMEWMSEGKARNWRFNS